MLSTLDLLQIAAEKRDSTNFKGRHAAEALHCRISEAGHIAELTGGFSPSRDRFELHDAVSRILQSHNGERELVVCIGSGSNLVEVSYNGGISQHSPWLTAKGDHQYANTWTEHNRPEYWTDGNGTHLEVLLLVGDIPYIYRHSSSGRAHYAIRIAYWLEEEENPIWGQISDPIQVWENRTHVFYDDAEASEWIDDHVLPVTRLDLQERHWNNPKGLAQDGPPTWFIQVEPYNLDLLEEQIDRHILSCQQGMEKVWERVDIDLTNDNYEDEDEERYLGASTLAKLKKGSKDLFDEEEE